MFLKFIKFLISITIIMYQSALYSQSISSNKFDSKNFSKYFSGIIAFENQNNSDALKFFDSSKILLNEHNPYLKKYISSLVLENKISRAINLIKNNKEKKNINFFDAYFLLFIDSLKRDDFNNADKFLIKAFRYVKKDELNLAILETLKQYIHVFQEKEFLKDEKNFGNLSLIAKTFQKCFLNDPKTDSHFVNLVEKVDEDFSRYKFFYINYLISEDRIIEANKIVKNINSINSTLLLSQAKNWLDEDNSIKFNNVFSCQNPNDIISEFLFLISNLYSSYDNLEKSNFYLNLSNYLNPKFKFNLTLIAENYYNEDDYIESKKILLKFNKNDGIYNWYQIKKRAKIIYQSDGEEESISFIISKFNTIKDPSIRIVYDMANILKNFKKFETAIGYYNEVISKTKKFDISYAELLYRRGGCYERIREYNKSDQDLLKSLEIKPNDAYVLNYLAYSWLERNYKIEVAIEMLERAHKEERNDPYILDSIGWAYYLIGDFIKAEKFLTQAIKLMPDDPIVNDHYGDILWMMDRKIQARYYWKSVLAIEDADEDMKKNINDKLLFREYVLIYKIKQLIILLLIKLRTY